MHNENGECFYQGETFINLKNFPRKKRFHQKHQNIVLYLTSFFICEERFAQPTGDGENVEIDTTLVDGEKIVHNICTVHGIRNRVLPNGIPVNSDNVALFLKPQLKHLEILFNVFEEVFLKINYNIGLNKMKKEYISIRINFLNHLSTL